MRRSLPSFEMVNPRNLRSSGLATDEKALGELWQSARRMEGRIEALEKVLDSEAPGWGIGAGG